MSVNIKFRLIGHSSLITYARSKIKHKLNFETLTLYTSYYEEFQRFNDTEPHSVGYIVQKLKTIIIKTIIVIFIFQKWSVKQQSSTRNTRKSKIKKIYTVTY